ncbi:hypothetical protein U1Q18_050105 [Sarracenia purpurea var. burkii]
MVDQGISYTLDEGLNTIRFEKCQGRVLAYAGLGWSAEVMGVMLLPFAGPAVKSEWGLSPGEESRITTVLKFPGCTCMDSHDRLGSKVAGCTVSPTRRFEWRNSSIRGYPFTHSGPKKTEDSETSSSSTLALFSPKLVRTTFLLWSVFFGSTFSYYGIVLPTSQRSSEERVAI